MSMLHNIRIGIKTQFATVTIVVLFAAVALSVVVLRTVLASAVHRAVVTASAVNDLNVLGTSLQDYLEGGMSFADVQKSYDTFQTSFKANYSNALTFKFTLDSKKVGASDYLATVWQGVQKAEDLSKTNAGIEADAMAATTDALSKSNDFLSGISQRLADPVEQRKVTVLERKVIQGASINTNSNYTIQLLFKDVVKDVSKKDALMQFLDKAAANASADAKSLQGTPFAQLPVDSLAAIQKARALAEQYVANQTQRLAIHDQVKTEMASLASQISDGQARDIQGTFSSILEVMSTAIYLFAVLVALVVAVQLLVSRSITKPIRHTVDVIKELENGNFSVKARVSGKDDSGVMLASLNVMIQKVQGAIQTVRDSAEQVASSSEQISASAQKLAEGAQSQASSLEQTSASVEELTASVEQVAEHSQGQASAVEQGTASMTQVQKSMEEVSTNLDQISNLAAQSVDNAMAGSDAVAKVVTGIKLIADSSERIGGIVNVITDIADQTNLLALNASIEAARAGEHGRGFAVVADEVSKLAERSASSTKEIGTLIAESVKSVNEGVQIAVGSQSAMEQIREASQKVRDMIAALSQAMGQQVTAIRQMSDALSNISEKSASISAATEEQTTNARQVAKAVENVNELTQSAASSAEEMSAATEQLSGMAQDLQRLMGQFKIDDTNGARKLAVIEASSRGNDKRAGGNGNGHGGNGHNGNGKPAYHPAELAATASQARKGA